MVSDDEEVYDSVEEEFKRHGILEEVKLEDCNLPELTAEKITSLLEYND